MDEQYPTIIFLHIPKAGGTTLHKIIERQYPRERIYHIQGNRVHESLAEFKQLPEEKLRAIRVLKGHMPFGMHEFIPRPAVYFTILRDPVERVISLYYFIRRLERHRFNEQAQKMTLSDFIASGLVAQMDNGQTRLLAGYDSSLPFGQTTPGMLDTAKKNLERFFAIAGVLEQYDAVLLLLQRRFGWKMPFYIRRNVTHKRPRPQEISPDVLAQIESVTELDRELYEYAQARMQQQIRDAGDSFSRVLSTFRLLNRLYTPYGRVMNSLRARLRFLNPDSR